MCLIEIKSKTDKTIKVYPPDEENEIEIELDGYESIWLSKNQVKELIEMLKVSLES